MNPQNPKSAIQDPQSNALVTVGILHDTDEIVKYHPHFLAAVQQSAVTAQNNRALPCPDQWLFPAITFTTDDWTRRSMTLNGMRMSTEYFATGSPRVFKLIEQRLEAGQSDVVHDVLVYLWERVLQLRTEAQEARCLQAESLAAYLGLEQERVVQLFLQSDLSNLVTALECGVAGTPRRVLEIRPLAEDLLLRLQSELTHFQQSEARVHRLIDEILLKLYQTSS